MSNIQFWYHPYFNYTSINATMDKYSNYKSIEFDKSLVDTTKINIIPFYWENSAQIGLDSIIETDKFIEILKKLNKLGFYLLGDFSTEVVRDIDLVSKHLFNTIISKNFDLNRFFLVQNNAGLSNQCGIIKYGNHYIKTLHIPHFILNTSMEMNNQFSDVKLNFDRIPTKDYLCLNRRMRYDKFLFLKKIWNRGLLHTTNFTYVSNYVPKKYLDNDSFAKYLKITYDNFKPIQLNEDVHYGVDLDFKDEYLYTINPKWYYDSKVNIVVETWPGNNPIHITEKTLKPIFLGIPFTVYGSVGFLDKLKEFGFNVFDNVIGEYDCTNITSVIDASIQLAKVYDSDDVNEIVKYNYNLIRDVNILRSILQTTFTDILVENLKSKPIKLH